MVSANNCPLRVMFNHGQKYSEKYFLNVLLNIVKYINIL